ncbi:MAG: hypothetical protein WAO52_18910 [Prolixibacteraceae bacterium]
MNREEWDKKLIADRGQEYFDKNKGLLDSQWDYIESLGEPSNETPVKREDLIILKPEFPESIKKE